jgi:hypothetical protein
MIMISQNQNEVPDLQQLFKNLVYIRPAVCQVPQTDQQIILPVETRSFETLNQGTVCTMDIADYEAFHLLKLQKKVPKF